LIRAAFADLTRDGTLASIRWAADDPAKPRDSVYRLLDWCWYHPTSKTATNVLRHLRQIVNDRPTYMTIAAALSSDVSSRERHRAVTRLIEELHDDTTADVDAADRMEIFRLLL
jgi:gamma-glutamyl:cysteine ligase YbdK (ATP-grasp superfamily)